MPTLKRCVLLKPVLLAHGIGDSVDFGVKLEKLL